jgi:hypothetical protein
MGKVKIQESEFDLADGGKGKIAILLYVGEEDPVGPLDEAVRNYVGHHGYMEFIDINMDNPWTRVIVSGVKDMKQVDFDPKKHKISNT